jgi:Holliday junction resolvase
MHNEKAVKDAVKRRLKKYGAWYTMPYQAGYSARGVPDIIACYQGRFIAIECKFGKNRLTALQTTGRGASVWSLTKQISTTSKKF